MYARRKYNPFQPTLILRIVAQLSDNTQSKEGDVLIDKNGADRFERAQGCELNCESKSETKCAEGEPNIKPMPLEHIKDNSDQRVKPYPNPQRPIGANTTKNVRLPHTIKVGQRRATRLTKKSNGLRVRSSVIRMTCPEIRKNK